MGPNCVASSRSVRNDGQCGCGCLPAHPFFVVAAGGIVVVVVEGRGRGHGQIAQATCCFWESAAVCGGGIRGSAPTSSIRHRRRGSDPRGSPVWSSSWKRRHRSRRSGPWRIACCRWLLLLLCRNSYVLVLILFFSRPLIILHFTRFLVSIHLPYASTKYYSYRSTCTG